MPTYTYPADLSTIAVGTWVAGQSYAAGAVVVPTVLGAFLFKNEGTAAGISGAQEPTWPSVVGQTVVDGTITWTAIAAPTIAWQADLLDATGTTEPVWPTTAGATVADNGLTWTAINKNIKDANCPNTTSVISAASKIFAANGNQVSYCATDNPTDWSTPNDAGYLPTGMQAISDQVVTALGLYRGNLAVFMASGIQIWQVDPDPSKMAILDYLNGYGTSFPRAHYATVNDLYFLTNVGVRSISVSAGTANMSGGDVGTPIDKLIQSYLSTAPGTYNPIGYYFAGQGQYWVINGTSAWVLTQSQVASLNEWSEYEFPVTITDVTTLDGVLYLRDSNGNVYTLDDEYYQDDTSSTTSVVPLVQAQTLYLNMGISNIMKQFIGMDVVADGTSVNIAIGVDETDFTQETAVITAIADTTTTGLVPIPCGAVSFSFLLTHQINEAWELYALGLFYNVLRTWR